MALKRHPGWAFLPGNQPGFSLSHKVKAREASFNIFCTLENVSTGLFVYRSKICRKICVLSMNSPWSVWDLEYCQSSGGQYLVLNSSLNWSVVLGFVDAQAHFSPATIYFDFGDGILKCDFLIHPLTWKPCHISDKDGRRQWYGLLQCVLALLLMVLAFHKCCRWLNVLYYRLQGGHFWWSLTWSGDQDPRDLHWFSPV